MAAEESKTRSLLSGFIRLLGVGPHLLVLGLVFEGLTLALQRWVSLPLSLSFGTQIVLSMLCVIVWVWGLVWFNRSLNLVEINLRNGENRLVTHGPFNYVRHPLYAVCLITIPPLFLIWYANLLFVIPWVLLFVVARYVVAIEERGLVEAFGEDYERYRRCVPALLPYKGAGGQRYRELSGDYGPMAPE
jgi:protein-S-isoprenylcysteine O-methyltransferase Ste14